jgi:hypothetical protein
VRDLVRVHQEVFDQLILFTLSEDDCEYPSVDDYGPQEFVLDADTYPYPDIEGVMTLGVEMASTTGGDLWTISSAYAAVSAGSDLSSDPRSVLDGSGTWTLRAPGRDHELSLSLAVDGSDPIPVELSFGISDYISSGYIFGVTGSLGEQDIEATVEATDPCSENG